MEFIKENKPAIPQENLKNANVNTDALNKTKTTSGAPLAPSTNSPVVNKAKSTIVKFDSETEAPFTVKFSERGFLIDGTRLSFEALHNAISKGYTITLNNGQGMELTPVRMQKILKYEDTYQ